MARSDRIRHQLFLPRPLSIRLEMLGAKSGTTRSAILAAALAAYLDREGAGEMEHAFALRLDRMSRQLGRIERDGHVVMESLALFVRYMLAVNAPLAEEDDASRAIGRERFAAFIARVGQQLESGRRTFEPESSQ
jgi:hypothetical protein